MTVPGFPLSSPWTDTESLNAAKLAARTTTPMNTLATAVAASNAQVGGVLVSRSNTLSVSTASFSAVPSFNNGIQYSSGSFSYGSGVFTNNYGTQILAQWGATVSWPAITASHRKIMLVYLSGVAAPNNEGRQDLYYPANSYANGAAQSAGGLIVMPAAATLQLYLYQDSGATVTVTPQVFSIARAG